MNNTYIPEIWKDIQFEENISKNEVFKISNHGRVKSFKKDTKNGSIVNPSLAGGYKMMSLKQNSGKRTGRYIHRLVALNFIEKENEDQNLVIHIDYDRKNNHILNLKWATEQEKVEHNINNPNKTKASRAHNTKLTEGRVKMIKKKLLDPNRKTRMKILAKQFGISEMQLYRIKTGENWGYVTVD